jgi:hypothetical protein
MRNEEQYIDRYRLLNALAEERFTRRHGRPARPFTVADCLRIVRGLPGAGLWIPVAERLPLPETEVLCAFDSGEVCSLWQDWAHSRDEDPFLYGEDPSFRRVKRATHWMPLPLPPEKGGAPCPTTM